MASTAATLAVAGAALRLANPCGISGVAKPVAQQDRRCAPPDGREGLLHAAIEPRVQRIGRLEQRPGEYRREAHEGAPGDVVGVVRLVSAEVRVLAQGQTHRQQRFAHAGDVAVRVGDDGFQRLAD
jgi:hypothetical protein